MLGIDLFAGAGGMSAGFVKAGYEFVIANEIDFNISKTYMANHPNTLMINDDIKKICDDFDNSLDKAYSKQILYKSLEEIKSSLSNIDIIIGGPPCQGFSMAGARIRNHGEFINDDRNMLFKYYFKMIQKFEPRYFVFENVTGLTTIKEGAILNEIISIFQDSNNFRNGAYHVSYEVLNASDFGVPQARKRLIIIGSKKVKIDIKDTAKYIKEIMTQSVPDRFTKVTLKDAISDLNYLNSNEGSHLQEYKFAPKSSYQIKRRANSSVLYNHKSTKHNEIALNRMSKIAPGDNYECLDEKINSIHSGSYGRLCWNDMSNTITTRFDTPSGGRVIHPELNRTLTPREAARIQSFDDDYIFIGNKTSISKQIGNAVPPLMAEVLAQLINLIDTL